MNYGLDDSPVGMVMGPGKLDEIGRIARAEGAGHVLLVTDRGLIEAGHALTAVESLSFEEIEVTIFDKFGENPTVRNAESGVEFARKFGIDFIASLGGGSAMDCAKAINLLLANGGKLNDYRGDVSSEVLKGRKPLLPMIAIPTTAGTGSEAQSFAVISDDETHEKMAVGDRRLPMSGGMRPRVAILDPDLLRTVPPLVAAMAGIDALSHAVETAATTARNVTSLGFTRESWRLLSGAFQRAMSDPNDEAARSDMLLGAHLAGCAIEFSMLGAAHACANPLTARYGITHGLAVGIMLPHVIRFNAAQGDNPYAAIRDAPEMLAVQIEAWLNVARLPRRLRDCNVREASLPVLAADAAKQWTAGFNARPVGPSELLSIYRAAFA